jgi:hypothetical protein
VLLAIPEFTDVFVPIRPGIGALTVPYAIPEFTDVFSVIPPVIGAKAVIVILVLV